jgi:hypothetical protein
VSPAGTTDEGLDIQKLAGWRIGRHYFLHHSHPAFLRIQIRRCSSPVEQADDLVQLIGAP